MEETHVPGSRFGNNNSELFAVAGIKFTARIRIRRMKKSQLPQDFSVERQPGGEARIKLTGHLVP